MKKYILCVDIVGKTGLEMATLFNNSEIRVINTTSINNISAKPNEIKRNVKLIVWSIYKEDNSIFEEIIKLRQIEKYKKIPIVIISNVSKNEFVMNAIKSGVNDFIIRPYNKMFIKNKIQALLNLDSKVKYINLSQVEEKVNFSFKEILSIQLKGANRGNYPVSLVMMSLEKCRELSIEEQEQIIDIIQKIFTRNARGTDLIIKYNKNSLLMILPYTDEKGVKVFYNKILDLMAKSAVLMKRATGAIISCSYDTLPREYFNNIEDIIIKKLQSKLRVCVAISDV